MLVSPNFKCSSLLLFWKQVYWFFFQFDKSLVLNILFKFYVYIEKKANNIQLCVI